MAHDAQHLPNFVAGHLAGGLEFEGRVLGHGAQIRERSKNEYGSALLDSRLQLLAIAEAAYQAHEGEPGTSTPSTSDRLVLLAAFFQGVGATEGLISEGQYVKAAASLKQDLEILARIHETLQGAAKPGKTPNVKYAPAGAGRIYGQLNDVAHPSTPDLLATLLGSSVEGDARGVSYVPTLVPENAVALYEIHVWLLFEMCRELIRIMHDLYGQDERFVLLIQWWWAVARLLVAGGHISEAPSS